MANRRMLSKEVVTDDWFTDMPMGAKLLYIYISMQADDDGFISSVKGPMAMSGASKDDFAVLVSKRYILEVRDGLHLVKHWRVNNYIQKDRYKESRFHKELEPYYLKEDGSYTLEPTDERALGGKTDKPKAIMTEARSKRLEARQESELPSSFDYKIRHAFNGKQCPICGVTMNEAYDNSKPTIQHNVPITLGGKHEIDNISVICQHCNSSIQNHEITGPLNNQEVREVWDCIGNGYTGKDSIGKVSLGKDSIGKASEEKKEKEKNNPDYLAHADVITQKDIDETIDTIKEVYLYGR